MFKVVEAVPLNNMEVLVFFEDGKTKKFDVKTLLADHPEFEALKNPEVFRLLKVEPGGYGISWTSELDCSEGELYENGIEVPRPKDREQANAANARTRPGQHNGRITGCMTPGKSR